jgi:molecular chaperone HtpG
MAPSDEPSSGKLTINLPNVIRTLGEYLYSDPNVAVRELLQNAHDTCVVAQAVDADGNQRQIHVRADTFERILIVQDNGAGMTEAEVRKFLTVIGSSRTDEVRGQLEALGQQDVADRLIGRFGIGLLAAFIIGDRVEFRTRSRKEGSPLITWECDGGAEYRISKLEETNFPFGTTVTLHVNPEYLGILNAGELERLIHRYADLLRVPIYLGDNPRPINIMTAPWDRSASLDEYREFLEGRFPHDGVLDIITLDINEDAGKTRVRGVLFIPKQPQLIVREYGDVTIYCHRYFVCDEERKLLPPWARFVRGLIDTPTLREMASREAVLRDENYERVQAALGRTLLQYLSDRHRSDPKLFREIVTSHNTVIKAWAVACDELFERVKDMVVFLTDDGRLSLPQYFQRSGSIFADSTEDAVRRIFFFTTRGGSVQQSMLFKAKGLPVIDASSFPDVEFLTKYSQTTEGVELHHLDGTALGFIFDPVTNKERKWRELEAAYGDLHINAEVVCFVPDTIPAVLFQQGSESLTEAKDLLQDPSLSPTIKSLLRRAIEQQQRAIQPGTETLYLNANNVVVSTLVEVDLKTTEAMEVVRAVYYNASLFSVQGGKPLLPKRAKEIFEGNNRTLATLMSKIIEVRRLQDRIVPAQLKAELPAAGPSVRERQPEHIMCFFAVPFRDEYDVVLEALRSVLEDAPYFWEVARADRKFFERTVPDNVGMWISRAQCYVVELSDCNPNVMMELGQMYWGYPGRPIYLLQREGSKPDIVDLGARLRIKYPWSDRPSREDIERTLRAEFAKFTELPSAANKRHYLSAYAMKDLKWIDQQIKQQVAQRYTTIEEFVSRDSKLIAEDMREYGVPVDLVKVIQDGLRSRLEKALERS